MIWKHKLSSIPEIHLPPERRGFCPRRNNLALGNQQNRLESALNSANKAKNGLGETCFDSLVANIQVEGFRVIQANGFD